MSYRQGNNLDKNLIFSEYFNSEQEVRRNGGVPTNVTITNGQMIPDSQTTDDNVIYARSTIFPSPNPTVFSLRIKAEIDIYTGSVSLMFDSVNSNKGCRLYYNDGNDVFYFLWGTGSTQDFATIGSFSSYGLLQNGIVDIVAVYDSINSESYIYMDGNLMVGPSGAIQIDLGNLPISIGDLGHSTPIELVEVYNKVLTQEEVTNLYNDARYKMPNLEHDEQLGPELITSIVAAVAQPYESVTISGNNISAINTVGNGSSYDSVLAAIVNPSQVYKFTCDFVINSGTAPSCLFILNGDAVAGASSNTVIPISGHNELYIIPNVTSGDARTFAMWNNVAANWEMTNISLELVTIPETKKILHVTAKDGVARNLLSGDWNGVRLMDEGKGTFNDGTTESWTTYGANVIENEDNTLKITYVDSANGASMQLRESNDLNQNLVVGRKYRIYARVKSLGTTNFLFVSGPNIQSEEIPSDWAWLTTEFVATHVTDDRLRLTSFTGTVWIDEWFIQEIIPSVTNTDIEIVREGSQYVPRFNGSTSKIDCGSYHNLTGDITVLTWVNAKTLGELNLGIIIDNSKLRIFVYNVGAVRFRVQNDASTDAFSDTNVFKYSENKLLAVTRTAAGITNIYVDGELSGTANQNAGTPVAGTTNILIGNVSALNRTWDGEIAEVQILSGLLTAAEINQAYTSSKHLYNK